MPRLSGIDDVLGDAPTERQVNHKRKAERRLPSLTRNLKNDRPISRTTIRQHFTGHIRDQTLPRKKRLPEKLSNGRNLSAAACAA